MSDKVDYLDEDPVISEQKYCVVSVLTPKNFKDVDEKSTMYTFKVRGSYGTVEEAQKRIQLLNQLDPNVNIYLAEVGKWCPFEDDPEKAKDAVYKDEELNRLMKGYKENQEKAKELFEVRKAEMVAKALADTKEKKEKLKKEDEEERSKAKIEDSIADKEKEVKEKEEKIVEGKKVIEQKKEVIQSKEDKIRKLNDEVASAKKKYEEKMAKLTINKSETVV
jgi:flagellar biosynthesis GTPase FlhF